MHSNIRLGFFLGLSWLEVPATVMLCQWSSACDLQHFFFNVALRPRKRDGLLGMGTEGEGSKEWRLDCGNRPKKTRETVDRHQNNGNVKAMSLRHCPATCALRNCCFNCCAWTESQRQCTLHRCWRTTWTTRSKRSPTFAAQLHLPTHDLFWANLKVQLHFPPLRSLAL